MKIVRSMLVGGAMTVAAGVVVVTQVVADGDVSVGFIDAAPAGTLVLETNSGTSLRVAHYDAEGVLVDDESITLRQRDKCQIDPTAFGRLLDFEGLDGDAPATFDLGLVSNGLGSRESNNCASGNGRLDDGQAFRLSLGTDFDDGTVIDRAELDIEGKFSSNVSFQTENSGDIVEAGTFVLSGASDNGSDSGAADNTSVPIGVDGPDDDFDALTIAPTSADGRGEIALEGGGDHQSPADNRTIFWLTRHEVFEYEFDCGASEEEDGEELGIEATPGLADDVLVQATIVRYDHYDPQTGEPTDGCQPIGADLSGDDGLGVLLRKTTTSADGTEQNPQIRIELVWVLRQDSATLSEDLAREIDFDGDGDDFDFEATTSCLSYVPDGAPVPSEPPTFSPIDPDNDGLDGFIDVDHPGTAIHPDDDRFDAGILPWCLVLDERVPSVITVDGDEVPVIVQRQVWDGEGDPRWI